MNIINHHGYWFDGEKIGTDETLNQMTIIHQYIANLSGSIFLTGDLNLLPQSESLKDLNEALNNLCITHDLSLIHI